MIQHPLELLMIKSDKLAYLQSVLSNGGAESLPCICIYVWTHLRDYNGIRASGF